MPYLFRVLGGKMLVTKQQIINGIVKYIEDDVVPSLPNKNLQIMARGFAASILFVPQIADKVLENEWVKMLKTEDGKYNLDKRILERAFGDDELTISKKIPFITKGEEMNFSFNKGDVDKIIKHIGG